MDTPPDRKTLEAMDDGALIKMCSDMGLCEKGMDRESSDALSRLADSCIDAIKFKGRHDSGLMRDFVKMLTEATLLDVYRCDMPKIMYDIEQIEAARRHRDVIVASILAVLQSQEDLI